MNHPTDLLQPIAENTYSPEFMFKRLTFQEQVFISAYSGDELYAARLAGFEAANEAELKKIARAVLKRPEIQDCLAYKGEMEELGNKAVASREERLQFYTAIMRNRDPHKTTMRDAYGNEVPMDINLKDRMKAAENLSKALGDFVVKVDVNHTHSISDLIKRSYDVSDDIHTLEAEWKAVQEAKKVQAPQPVVENKTFEGLL